MTDSMKSMGLSLANRAYARGVEDERERIIKLLPEYMATVLSWGHETATKQLVALIKGENK